MAGTEPQPQTLSEHQLLPCGRRLRSEPNSPGWSSPTPAPSPSPALWSPLPAIYLLKTSEPQICSSCPPPLHLPFTEVPGWPSEGLGLFPEKLCPGHRAGKRFCQAQTLTSLHLSPQWGSTSLPAHPSGALLSLQQSGPSAEAVATVYLGTCRSKAPDPRTGGPEPCRGPLLASGPQNQVQGIGRR